MRISKTPPPLCGVPSVSARSRISDSDMTSRLTPSMRLSCSTSLMMIFKSAKPSVPSAPLPCNSLQTRQSMRRTATDRGLPPVRRFARDGMGGMAAKGLPQVGPPRPGGGPNAANGDGLLHGLLCRCMPASMPNGVLGKACRGPGPGAWWSCRAVAARMGSSESSSKALLPRCWSETSSTWSDPCPWTTLPGRPIGAGRPIGCEAMEGPLSKPPDDWRVCDT